MKVNATHFFLILIFFIFPKIIYITYNIYTSDDNNTNECDLITFVLVQINFDSLILL